MKNAVRRKLAPLEPAPDTSALDFSSGASPVHALQDRLVSHFATNHLPAPPALARPVRMAVIFWSAVAAWLVVAAGIWAATAVMAA